MYGKIRKILKKIAKKSRSDNERIQQEEQIVNYLNKSPHVRHYVDEYKQTLLIWASKYGNIATVKYLISKRVNLNASTRRLGDPNHGKTALHWAYDSRHDDIILALLDAGAIDTGINCEFQSIHERGTTIVISNQFMIHKVTKDGRLSLVKALIDKQPALLKQKNGNGETPLLLAARHHFTKGVLYFISKESDINVAFDRIGDPNHGKTILHWMYDIGQYEELRILMERGAVDTPVNGDYVFDKAVKDGRLDVMQLLITLTPNFWDKNACYIDKWINMAAGHMVKDCFYPDVDVWEPGYPDVVEYLALNAKLNGIEINLASKRAKFISNKEAILYDKPMSVLDLLRSGANLDEPINIPKHPSHGKTPVQWAYECGHYIKMALLLDAGASVDEFMGLRIIHQAINYARIDTIESLFDKHPSLKNYRKIHERWGGTAIEKLAYHVDFREVQHPLILAARKGYKHVVRYCIEIGVNLNATIEQSYFENVIGKTALRFAYEARQYSVVEMLIGAGAKDLPFKGVYLIHEASRNGHLNIIKLLLKSNPTLLNRMDSFGQPPLLCAASKGHAEIVEYLLSLRASTHLATKLPNDLAHSHMNNRTALDWAMQGGHTAVCDILIREKATTNTHTELVAHYMTSRNLKSLSVFKEILPDEDIYVQDIRERVRDPGLEKVKKKLTRRQEMCRHSNACPGSFQPKWLHNNMWNKEMPKEESPVIELNPRP